MNHKLTLLLVLCLPLGPGSLLLHSQENVFTAGFQYRPILPNTFFTRDAKPIEQNGIGFAITQKTGASLGMIVRRGFTKMFSIETGINYTKRNYNLLITDTSFSGKSDFKIVGYEIPIQGMIFMRLSKRIYMNTGLGVSVDMYPTNIYTSDTAYFRHFSKHHGVFQFAALADLGFEYRTEKMGYFYLGASYHLPFSYFYESAIRYDPKAETGRIKLSGSFLTLDLRYYFHEEPIRNKKKKPKATAQ